MEWWYAFQGSWICVSGVRLVGLFVHDMFAAGFGFRGLCCFGFVMVRCLAVCSLLVGVIRLPGFCVWDLESP